MQKYAEIEVRKNKFIRGMVHIPDGKKKFPIMVLAHGFTGNKVEAHFLFTQLSRTLEKNGIGAARFDFYGSGDSDGDFSEMTMSGEINDLKKIIRFILRSPYYDGRNLILLGFSMGGEVSAITAPAIKKLSGLILLNPAADMKAAIINKENEEKIRIARSHGFYAMGSFKISYNFILDIKKHDILKEAKGFNKNVLLIACAEDKTVPPQSAFKYKTIYPKIETHIIKNGDHILNSIEAREEFKKIVLKWCKKIIV